MSIFLFIVILCVLIVAHEFGHFIAAKRAGIRVDEFAIGFPPRLFKKRIGETLYSINAFPVGGFVKIFGENPDEESIHGKDAKRSFVHKPKLVQAWVISAGIIFNLLLAYVLISLGFMIGVPYSRDDLQYGSRVTGASLVVSAVHPDSPASRAGVKAGDEILALYGGADALEHPGTTSVQDFVAHHETVTLAVKREGSIQTLVVIPEMTTGIDRPVMGISMDNTGMLKLPIHEALFAGLTSTASITVATAVGLFDFFKDMLTGQASFDAISGPVGIVKIVGDASTLGFVYLLSLTAIISINLAIINILPFPALDGGRLLFVIIESIKGSPIKPVVANSLNGIGFILLILLMVVVTYHDIAKLIAG